MAGRKHRLMLVVGLVLGLVACNVSLIRPRLTPTPRPSHTPLPLPESLPTPTLPPPTITPTISPDWEMLLPGLELREMQIVVEGVSRPVIVTLTRIDPARFEFRVHYTPDDPATIAEWQARTGATLLINGGFFMTDNRALGLIVVDGEPFGVSFDGHGGMLSVTGGEVGIRSLEQFPYRPGEPLDQAVQGRPMLLYPGSIPAEFDLSADLSRRTAVAQDNEGRILYLVNDYGALSLYDLRDWLAYTAELDLAVALNLDGGGSTGLALIAGGRSVLIDSWSAVPDVVAVYPRP